jgi:glycosyltransferase involved in cell wall biosynthesis
MTLCDSEPSLPKISIVTPSYNQGQYLEKTIQSVLDQHYPNLEYIIIDGGSLDNSTEIIKKYEKYLKYWVSEPDRGQSHAINKGFKHATGDLFAWLNSDDYYMLGALDEVAKVFREHPDAGAIVGTGQIINSKGEVTYYKEPTEEITIESLYNWLNGGNFSQPSCMFTRAAWEQCGPLDEEVHIAFDLDFWLRMAKKGFNFVVTQKLLSTALTHREAKTTAFEHLMRVDISLIIMRHGGGEQAVRKHLENMAQRLAWYELKVKTIENHPIVKAVKPFLKLIAKLMTGRREITPKWQIAAHEDGHQARKEKSGC